MSGFDPGIHLEFVQESMDFRYGQDCFGPIAEKRHLDSIRKSLMDPACEGPDPVYSIVMDVGKRAHKPILHELHLLFGVVSFAPGRLGKEPVRSQGHVHRQSKYASGWSTPELYEIWQGEAIIYMQERPDRDSGLCYAVRAGKGNKVLVPPGWAHMTINASVDKPMIFGALCDRDYGFDYEDVRRLGGLAWFPLLDEEDRIGWISNDSYHESELIRKMPQDYSEFGLSDKSSIYSQFENNPVKFTFISRPDLFSERWKTFIP